MSITRALEAGHEAAERFFVHPHLAAAFAFGVAEVARLGEVERRAVGAAELGDVEVCDALDRVHVHAGRGARQRIALRHRPLQAVADLGAREFARARGVDAAQAEHRRAELRIALCIPDGVACTRAHRHVAVARRIDDDARHDRAAAALVLDQYRGDAAALGGDRDRRGVQQHVDAVRGRHLVQHALQAHRVVRHTDDAAMPLRRPDGVDRGEAILQLEQQAADDAADLRVVAHRVDAAQAAERDDRQRAAEAAVALDQQRACAGARRRACGADAGRPAADHQHVGLGDHRHVARRLADRLRHVAHGPVRFGATSTAPCVIGCTTRS